MANGKDYRLRVSTAGTAATPLVEVEFQGDLTINTGKTNERTPMKNGTVTGQGEDGFSATCQIALREPMPAGQSELWEAHDNGTGIFIDISGPTGGLKYSGVVKVAITEVTAPVSGAGLYTIDLSQDGTITRGVAS